MPKLLRRLLRFALVLLILAAAFSGLRLWLDGKGRAILEKSGTRAASRPARPAMPPPTKPAGPAIATLPFFAGIYGTDPAAKAAYDALVKELGAFREAMRTAEQPVDFIRLLKKLGIPVPEGMTQAQAAAAFLKYAEKFRPFLDSLHQSLAGGLWDLGPHPAFDDTKGSERLVKAYTLLTNSSLLLGTLSQAYWLTGQPDLALASWQDMAGIGHQSSQPGSIFTYIMGAHIRSQMMDTADTGFTLGGWREADLAAISRSLADLDPIDAYRRGLEGERENMAIVMREFTLNREKFSPSLSVIGPQQTMSAQFQDMLGRLSYSLISDTQLAANAAIIDRRYEIMTDSFNYRDRVYVPPTSEDAAMLENSGVASSSDFFTQWYFQIANTGSGPNIIHNPITEQSRLDQTRLALALETQKRTTGSYPETLDALAPAFPGGLPHDVSTGQPYHYQKTPDGSFRLWGTGIDQTDNGGHGNLDILYKIPKPQ